MYCRCTSRRCAQRCPNKSKPGGARGKFSHHRNNIKALTRQHCRPKFKLLGHDNKQPLNPQLFFSSSCLSLSLKVVEDLDSVERSKELHYLSRSGKKTALPSPWPTTAAPSAATLLAFPLRVIPLRDHHLLTHPSSRLRSRSLYPFSETLQCVTSCVRASHSSLGAELIPNSG